MPAQLVSLTDGPNILVDKPILLIGRHPECDIQIDSRKISRRHCCIAQVADYLVVRDLGSTNGIRINGVRVLEGRLNEKDELTIGGLTYRVCWDLDSEPPKPSEGMRNRAEPQVPSQPIAGQDDELLEASDDPVALVDPRGDRSKRASERPPLPASVAVPPSEFGTAEPPRGRRAERSSAHIIPEELKLAPASDAGRHDPSGS